MISLGPPNFNLSQTKRTTLYRCPPITSKSAQCTGEIKKKRKRVRATGWDKKEQRILSAFRLLQSRQGFRAHNALKSRRGLSESPEFRTRSPLTNHARRNLLVTASPPTTRTFRQLKLTRKGRIPRLDSAPHTASLPTSASCRVCHSDPRSSSSQVSMLRARSASVIVESPSFRPRRANEATMDVHTTAELLATKDHEVRSATEDAISTRRKVAPLRWQTTTLLDRTRICVSVSATPPPAPSLKFHFNNA